MLSSDDDLLSSLDIRLHRASEILDKQGRTASVGDLVHALGVEELSRGLCARRDAIRAVHGHEVVGSELDVGMDEIVRDARHDISETLRAASVVREEIS